MAIGIVLVFGGTDIATIVKTRIGLLSDSGADTTYSEMRSVQKTMALLWAAESSKRGFLLTPRASFLAHYMLTATELRAELGQDNLLHIPEQIDAAKQQVAQPLHFRYRDEAMEFAKTADGPFSFRVPNANESAMLYATINDLSRPHEQHATVRPHANWEPSYKDLQPALAPVEVAQQHSFSRSGASFGMGAE